MAKKLSICRNRSKRKKQEQQTPVFSVGGTSGGKKAAAARRRCPPHTERSRERVCRGGNRGGAQTRGVGARTSSEARASRAVRKHPRGKHRRSEGAERGATGKGGVAVYATHPCRETEREQAESDGRKRGDGKSREA